MITWKEEQSPQTPPLSPGFVPAPSLVGISFYKDQHTYDVALCDRDLYPITDPIR